MTKGERTRQRIVEEAAKVFNRKGYDGTSIYDIMEAADIKKGGLYGHFSGKDEIALAAFKHAFKKESQRIQDAVAAEDAAPEKLVAIANSFTPYTDVDRGGCPVLNTAIEVDDHENHAELRARVRSSIRMWRRLIRGIVRDGIDAGEIHPHVDAEVVATLMISTIEGAVMMSRIERDAQHVQRAIQHLGWYVRHHVALS